MQAHHPVHLRSRALVQALDSCLGRKRSKYGKADTVAAMYTASNALYFPDNSTVLADNIFASPIITFLHPDGGYHDIWQIPPIMSKAQYSMRLRDPR
jgi:hypothetical protein